MLLLLNPVRRAERLDDPGWVFEPKFDGFRLTPFAAG
jgi:ATP-dependent DNA ligase